MKRSTIKRVLLSIFVPIFLLLLGWGYYILFGGNFATVENGILYRSAQPDQGDIKNYAKKYGIHTILNLRGKDKDQWYIDEIHISKELGITHYDIPLSALHEPSIDEMKTIISIMKNSSKPLLVHCQGGADRTGLAIALYEYAINKKPVNEAAKYLTPLHGHLPYLGNETIAMDRAFDHFVKQNPSSSSISEPRQ